MAASTVIPTRAVTKSLTQELATYEAHKAHLLQQSAGKYVLIKGDSIVGIFGSKEVAFQEGYRRFQLSAFMVQKIQPEFDTYYVGDAGLNEASEGDSLAPV